jgi:microcystin-dependent protein
MSEPFVAEIRIFGFTFAPRGWALCNGQLLAISQNTALFSLIGTFYGGNGTTNFALPNLQGVAPMFWGQGPGLNGYVIGEVDGEESITLLTTEMPAHSHTLNAFTGRGRPAHGTPAAGDALTTGGANSIYVSGSPNTNMAGAALGAAGGSQPHDNMMPSLVLNYCIALQGVFPARN